MAMASPLQSTQGERPHRAVALLQPCDAARVRAAHHIPCFAVAVEVAYMLLRSLLLPRPTREIRVVAAPFALGFTVDLLGAYQPHAEPEAAVSISGGSGAAAGLSDLTAVSQELRLSASVEVALGRGCGMQQTACSPESLEVLFERQWQGTDIAAGEEPWAVVCSILTTRLQERLRQETRQKNEYHSSSLLLHLRCEVRGLFYCMPVRQRFAAGGSHTSYRLRAERQVLLSTAYRMAVECILAPLYLSLHKNVGTSSSLYLHLSCSGCQNAAASDTTEVFYVHNSFPKRGAEAEVQLTKRRRVESGNLDDVGVHTHSLRTAHHVLLAFFPHLRLCTESLEGVNGTTSLRLREVVVDAGRFAVLFLLPAWEPRRATGRLSRRPTTVLGAVVVAKSTASTACHVVDESHRVYRQVASSFTTLCPIIVFLTESLLESNDAALRRVFRSAERIGRRGVASPQEAADTPGKEAPFAVVGDLTASDGALLRHKVAAAGLRVSSLTQRLFSVQRATRTGLVDGVPASFGPRRTPFCPPSWAGSSCGRSTLPRVRAAMRLTLDPAFIVPRAYAAPSVWPSPSEMDTVEKTSCPFSAEHFIAQWDRKFLLLHMNDNGACSEDSLFTANRSPPSVLSGALPNTGLLLRSSKQPQRQYPLPPALYIVDQHALHERLRLEFFMATAESYVQHHTVPLAFHVPIPDDIRHDVTAYESVLATWGWRFAHGSSQCGGSGCTKASTSNHTQAVRYCVAVLQWPHILLEGHSLHLDTMENLRITVEELLTVLPPRHPSAAGGAEVARDGNWTGQDAGARVLPSAVLRFLITRSCRGAVMFGDSLHAAAVEQLIDALQAVAQYTLCSHGRPSFAVIRRHRK
ncbi:hypothetical protein TraAM80_07619 [Trypanosoma rangeli]|uniref:MutL C-terminal dimerisation domain-containing protein n=1 Tax=Trypanosoma rangeli TaxID=5698 RepID=A0A3R7M6N6_TRYRA|nr:uncharacterized protein TraAM80_07619 [Trypanosoma rangeli]RNF00440.1 hypothetical protein TraAM80_07619 [Trypanosoma rangeli]|eukprot:RNF00440.1 hypothetical protein TraAM80_07619 [Trypanosoma rangeli]